MPTAPSARPIPWQELVESVERVLGDASKHISAPSLRIDVIELRRHDQRRHVAAIDDLEEQIAAARRDRQVTDLVDDEQSRSTQITDAL